MTTTEIEKQLARARFYANDEALEPDYVKNLSKAFIEYVENNIKCTKCGSVLTYLVCDVCGFACDSQTLGEK